MTIEEIATNIDDDAFDEYFLVPVNTLEEWKFVYSLLKSIVTTIYTPLKSVPWSVDMCFSTHHVGVQLYFYLTTSSGYCNVATLEQLKFHEEEDEEEEEYYEVENTLHFVNFPRYQYLYSCLRRLNG